MAIIILCTDGSDAALQSLREGLTLLPADAETHLITVIEPRDDTVVTGTGFAGGTMGADEYDALLAEAEQQATQVLSDTATALGVDAALRVVRGEPGPAICALAEEISASVIVMGSRGRGGVRRALLGSVSDHTVRNAPCSVLVTRHSG